MGVKPSSSSATGAASTATGEARPHSSRSGGVVFDKRNAAAMSPGIRRGTSGGGGHMSPPQPLMTTEVGLLKNAKN
jgi:hypothetical protein